MPKERPILFSGEMVRAILEGRKTQTRRVIKRISGGVAEFKTVEGDIVSTQEMLTRRPVNAAFLLQYCPYGQPGDRLWGRETFWRGYSTWTSPEGGELVPYPTKKIEYLEQRDKPGFDSNGVYMRKMPSIHMPRWASRLTLEITGIRVERVQEISVEDAIAEGIDDDVVMVVYPSTPERLRDAAERIAINRFHELWDSINARRGYDWNVNPWVWVIEFKQSR